MDGIVPKLRFVDKQKLLKHLKNCRDAKVKQRYLIMVNLISGRPPTAVSDVLQVTRSTVYRVAERFRFLGEAGLLDHREDNGQTKLDESYLTVEESILNVSFDKVGRHGVGFISARRLAWVPPRWRAAAASPATAGTPGELRGQPCRARSRAL